MTERELIQRRTREAVLTGHKAPGPGPRAPIAASWQRVAACGLSPGADPTTPPLDEAEVQRRRASSALSAHVPRLTAALASVVDAGQLVVVADTEGRVLWRTGSRAVRSLADRLGFVSGSAWTEGNVGTNAIGTSLVLGEGVHIQGPEHYVESHTRWGCAAVPLRDPWSGRTLGVVDVSGPSQGMHPAELALVEMAARLTQMQIVEQRRSELDMLRATAAPLLARIGGDALVVDGEGHLAAGIGARLPARIALPAGLAGGPVWLPTLGQAYAEPLGAGWLLRLDTDPGDVPTRMTLHLDSDPRLEVEGASGTWTRILTPRHAEILLALIDAGPAGRTAAVLAQDLFADGTRMVTVRAELSRLRKAVGSVLLSGPYRVSPAITASVTWPGDASLALPGSSAPVVQRLRPAPA